MASGQDGNDVDHHATTAAATAAQKERYERPRNSFTPINGRRSTAAPGPSQVQPDTPSSSTPPRANVEQGEQNPGKLRKGWLKKRGWLLGRQLNGVIQRGVQPLGQEQQQIQTPAQQLEQHLQQQEQYQEQQLPTRDWEPENDGSGKKTCPYCLKPARIKDAAEHIKVHRFQDMLPEYFTPLRKGGRCVRCRRGRGQICKVFRDPSRHKTFVCESCHSLHERCSHVDFKKSYNSRRVTVHPAAAMDAEV